MKLGVSSSALQYTANTAVCFSPTKKPQSNIKGFIENQNRSEANKDEKEEDGRENVQSAADLPLCRVSWSPQHPSDSSECPLQTDHSMSPSSSVQLCDLLLSRGKILDLISFAYLTEIMRKSMPVP